MAYERKYWVNRFPICSLVFKEAAQMLGYDEEESKSLGHARAVFFAAAKRGFGSGPSKKSSMGKYYSDSKKMERQGVDPKTYGILNFAGLETYIVRIDGHIRAFFGGKVVRPEEFDNADMERMIRGGGEAGYAKTRAYVRNKLSELNQYELNSGAVYKIYEKLRDSVREISFIKEGSMPKILGEVSIAKAGEKVQGGYVLTEEDLKLAAEMFPEAAYNEQKGTLTLPITSDDTITEERERLKEDLDEFAF